MEKYAEVILPLPVDGVFTYVVPERLVDKVAVGGRVLVPFGKKKFYTGIVTGLSPRRPTGFELKEITDVPETSVVLRHPQLKFWAWMAEYYLSPIGDVMKAALPARLKLESETEVALADVRALSSEMPSELSEVELAILSTLSSGKLRLTDLQKKINSPSLPVAVYGLMGKGLVVVAERMRERFRNKTIVEISVAFDLCDGAAVASAFDKVKRSNMQQEALMALMAMGRDKNGDVKRLSKDSVLEDGKIQWSTIKALEAKGLVVLTSKEVGAFAFDHSRRPVGPPALSTAQDDALQGIHNSFLDKGIVLLHGVTASGKTEIYMHLIDYVLKTGQQVLMLVPEIALTTQLTIRLQRVFGASVVVYHSKFTDLERASIWMDLLRSGKPVVVLGARSAVFLPYSKLGLVIVDEEHETSYKQSEPSPRYNARDAAIMLASMHGAKTLLGSATPSIETYYKALNGKFGLVSLTERYSGVTLPRVDVVDMNKERKKGAVTGIFADRFVSRVRRSVDNGKQAIIFLNRRGYSPLALCKQCSYTAKCDFCDVSLTYHRGGNRLVCHYCGNTYPVPEVCPQCGEPSVAVVGYGTERVEEQLANAFPNRKILRMDLDTTRDKGSYGRIISDFSEGKASILVGTQMVTKGLDFGNVDVVGAINSDSLINAPDFKSSSRAFNLLSQVAGRAGRRERVGEVMIQTREPENPVVRFVASHDYRGFYDYEIEERRKYAYPPFTRVINIYLKHRADEVVARLADAYANRLRELFGNRVLGPVTPRVGRVQNMFIRSIMLKLELAASPSKVKDILRRTYVEMHNLLPEKGLSLYYDVDP